MRLPAFALLCLTVAAPLAARALATTARGAARGALCAALLAQLVLLWQPPSAHAPAAGSERAWRALQVALRRCSDGGPAVALDHALLGGTPFMHTMALSDLRMAADSPLGALGTRALLDALQAPGAPAALAVGEHFPELDRVLAQRYQPCATLPAPRLATGYQPGRVQAGRQVQVVYRRAF